MLGRTNAINRGPTSTAVLAMAYVPSYLHGGSLHFWDTQMLVSTRHMAKGGQAWQTGLQYDGRSRT